MVKKDYTIVQGATFNPVVRWETTPSVFKAITGITKAAPAVVTATAHGVPDGWRVAIVSVVGMTEINAANTPPKKRDYVQVDVVDANTLKLLTVNSAEYTTYSSGGYVQYYTPVDLGGYTARMKIKDRIGGTELLSLTSGGGTIVLDNTAKTISLLLSATATAALTWKRGVYDLEMVAPDAVVTRLLYGAVVVSKEVTT
jgi:hypothetical protein